MIRGPATTAEKERLEEVAMRNPVIGWATATAALVAVFSLAPVPIPGHADAVAAQTPELPRAPDGKPDLSGFWQVLNTATWDI